MRLRLLTGEVASDSRGPPEPQRSTRSSPPELVERRSVAAYNRQVDEPRLNCRRLDGEGPEGPRSRRKATTVRGPHKSRAAVLLLWTLATGFPRALVPSASSPLALATVLRERRLHKGSPGLSAEAPDGWGFSTQTGYPAIVFLLVHPDGSKLSVSLSKTHASTGAMFADQNRAALRASRFQFLAEADGPRNGRVFDLRPAGTDQLVRQLYFVRPTSVDPAIALRPDGGAVAPSSQPKPREGAPAAPFYEGVVVTLVTRDALLAAHARDLVSLVESLTFDE